MMIDRREFIAGTTLLAVAPTLGLMPPQLPSRAASASRPPFLVDGWSIEDGEAENQVWIRVSRSWRTAWR